MKLRYDGPVTDEFPQYTLARGVIYGPVRSRRLGASLGVNLLPFGVKVCSFNCSYCQCGWTYDTVDHATLAKLRWPAPAEISAELEWARGELRARGEPLDSITLSGNGEPTLHPRFAEAVRAIVAARDRAWPGVRTDILTNGAHLGAPGVVEGLNLLDERMVKIDAGTEAMFLDMNTPVTPVSLQDVTGRVRELRDFIAQSMFTQGRIDNTGDDDVGRWADLLGELRPKLVQVYGISRAPADPRLRPVPHERLAWIADQARARGLSVQIA